MRRLERSTRGLSTIAPSTSAARRRGLAGTIDVLARSVRLFGLILANGSPSGTDSGGGDGGDISIEAGVGDITIAADISRTGRPGRRGGSMISRRSATSPQLSADVSRRGRVASGSAEKSTSTPASACRASGHQCLGR